MATLVEFSFVTYIGSLYLLIATVELVELAELSTRLLTTFSGRRDNGPIRCLNIGICVIAVVGRIGYDNGAVAIGENATRTG
ncbi:hypothetical protein DERF_013999 [Dermatophagoides farinae]|uniref:Uncharacterized protein n=1 Tax=Dermatophagoides farinae TaxID=6954 RepID=A0A922KWB6_DERFA|nr:hypothetical protein DERF_013999 [Dermatophagoides farinae]